MGLRLLTLNTHKGFSSFNRKFVLEELRNAIREVSADIVFLQEVIGEHSDHDEIHYEYLADSLWPNYAYGKNSIYTQGHHGNAILSKYPITRSHQMDISLYRLEQRGILHCEIEIASGLAIHCVCLHLNLLGFHRRRQYQLIEKYLEQNIPFGAPLLLAGDFNDWTGRAQELLATPLSLTEAHVFKHGQLARTYPSYFPLMKLDRIYCRGFEVESCQATSSKPWAKLSDHLGLTAELRINVPVGR